MLKSEMTPSARLKRQRPHGDCRSLSSVSTPASRVNHFEDLVAPGGWPELAKYEISSTKFRTNQTCSLLTEANSVVEGEIAKKRKGKKKEMKWKGRDDNNNVEWGNGREKKMKGKVEEDEDDEDESKITEERERWKCNSKASKEVQKSDYVHVRARRGQATDSHSLAERARREKISERMKYLQNLVPGCNKIAGKAGMLDEIINYVQSLQQQVEFLSMKVAALNHRVDFINVDDFLAKQVFPTLTTDCSSYFNQLGKGSTSVTVPQTPLINNNLSSITHFELSSTWGGDLQRFEEGGKNRKLNDLLDALEFNQVVIFVSKKNRGRELNRLLNECNFPSICITADLSQEERIKRYKSFKDFQKRILVTTDLFGRGMDIERVNIVVNYDFPNDSDQYLHRVGRAGRFGTKGLSISFISSEEDTEMLAKVQSRFEVNIPELPDQIDISTYMST